MAVEGSREGSTAVDVPPLHAESPLPNDYKLIGVEQDAVKELFKAKSDGDQPAAPVKGKKAGKKGKSGKKSVGRDQLQGKKKDDGGLLAPDILSEPPPEFANMSSTPIESDHGGVRGGISLPGVARVTLSLGTQELLGCVVGKHVSPESPWLFIDKTLIDDNIDLHSDSSDFLPVREEIVELKTPNVLVGYDALADVDNQFYICVTEPAQNAVLEILEQMREEQQKRLQRALEKKPQKWISLGSEQVVDLFTVKNARPYMQMQVETTVSDLFAPCNFQNRDVDDAVDGYFQYPHRDDIPEHITKLRIDEGVQVSLPKYDIEAQTEPGIPDNSWTQYEYSVDTNKPIGDEALEKALAQFLKKVQDEVCEALHYNEIMDLHRDDYGRLVLYEEDTETPQSVQYTEFMSFTDMKNCQGKFVSCVAFHPMWSGIVALSYVDHTRMEISRHDLKTDSVLHDVYGMHPVLIWSFVDAFKPKLFLDAPREVHSLAFAPHNENILVGGLANGQIILWDIAGKIERVELETKMTADQVKYNVAMNNLMLWMKSDLRIDYVRPVAISAVGFSHCELVSALHWISPQWEINNNGHFTRTKEGEQSLQVASSSFDGTIFFWNLLTSAGAGSILRSKRRKLSKRPEVLKTDSSPFSFLHRTWQPVYRLEVKNVELQRVFMVMSWAFFSQPVTYEESEENAKLTPAQRESMTTRFRFKPVLQPSEEYKQCSTALVGTMNGSVVRIEWQGCEDPVADLVNPKCVDVEFIAEIHSSPVFDVKRNPFIKDMFLSIGARKFAVWSDKLGGRPLFRRACRSQYNSGAWSLRRPSMLQLSCEDGTIEVWDFLNRSDTCILSQSVSGKALTDIEGHPQYLPNNLVGVSDLNGSFRLFFIPIQYQDSDVAADIAQMEKMVQREKLRRQTMAEWEKQWSEKNTEEAQKLKKEEEGNKKKAEAEKDEQKVAINKRHHEEMELENIQKKKESGHITKLAAKEQLWNEAQRAHMIHMILEKKKLQRSELELRRAPFIAAQEAAQLKTLKMREAFSMRGKVFRDIVEMLLPEIVRVPPRKKTAAEIFAAHLEDMGETFVERYYELEKLALEKLEPTPLEHTFNWKHTVQEGRSRREVLDMTLQRQSARLARAQERRHFRQLHQASEIRRQDERRRAKAHARAPVRDRAKVAFAGTSASAQDEIDGGGGDAVVAEF